MSGTGVEAGDAGRGESGYTKKVNSSTPSQNDSWAVWASQIDYSRQWKRIPGAFLTPLNSLFFFCGDLAWSLTDGGARSGDGELCRRIITGCGGGEGSAWIWLPAGSTSFPLDLSLNAATDFKDIWLLCPETLLFVSGLTVEREFLLMFVLN